MYSGINPSFSNYSHTELWRADVDDIGMAVLIASTAVESYTDNVGSAANQVLLGKGGVRPRRERGF